MPFKSPCHLKPTHYMVKATVMHRGTEAMKDESAWPQLNLPFPLRKGEQSGEMRRKVKEDERIKDK